MAIQTQQRSSGVLFFIGTIVFAFLGLWADPLYFAGSIALLSLMLARKPAQRRMSFMVLAFAVVYSLVVLGYGIGKDMAIRDTARDTSHSSGADPRD